MNKILYVAVLLLITIPLTAIADEYPVEVPSLNGAAALVMDAQSKEIIFEKNPHQIMYPASTTKMMTAILVLENCQLDEVVEVDFNSANTEGSSVYLQPGEQFTVEQMLHALLIASANDVAEALACHVAGSVGDFAKLMSTRAKELGAINTNFTNPHGLPDREHVTTAYDLAQIALHAITIPKLIEITSTARYQIPPTELYPQTRYLKNSNRFLWGTGGGNRIEYLGERIDIYYPAIQGIKTGYTKVAGNCLVCMAEKDNRQVISVVLNSSGNYLYRDTRYLLDYALYNYQTFYVAKAGQIVGSGVVKGGVKSKVGLAVAEDIAITVKLDGLNQILSTQIIPEAIPAPLAHNDEVGYIVHTINGEVVAKTPLVAAEPISELHWWWAILLILIVISIVLMIKKWSSAKYNQFL